MRYSYTFELPENHVIIPKNPNPHLPQAKNNDGV